MASPRPRSEVGRYAAFFHARLEGGVYLPPSAYEAWFVSAAHHDVAPERIAAALLHAARAAAVPLAEVVAPPIDEDPAGARRSRSLMRRHPGATLKGAHTTRA